MKKVVIVSACRTAIGAFGGTLKDVPAAELGALVVKEAVSRAGIKPEQVDEVIFGNVLQAGLGQNLARQVTLKAGLPIETTAVTINIVCGSGLKSVAMAANQILAGESEIVVCGGTENMSAAPYAIPTARWGARMNNNKIVDVMVNDGLWDAFNQYHMGITAENVAEKYGITREMQDEFAVASQSKAEAAVKGGKFKDEIVPVVIHGKKGDTVFDTDEYPKFGTTLEKVAKLKPAFKKDGGTVTAANASGINDSAAAFVVMSQEKAEELQSLLTAYEIDAKIVMRKKHYVVYVKEGSQIVELLGLTGAHVSLMQLENVRIVKEMRNSVNRKVNCETANLNKTVSAAVRQVEDIRYIQRTIGFQELNEGLAEMAVLRLEHPEASLKELGDLLTPPVGKSGVNHRLRKLSLIAEKLREGKEE